ALRDDEELLGEGEEALGLDGRARTERQRDVAVLQLALAADLEARHVSSCRLRTILNPVCAWPGGVGRGAADPFPPGLDEPRATLQGRQTTSTSRRRIGRPAS